MAASVSRQPPLVLSHARAGHRAGARRWSSRFSGPGSSRRPIPSARQNCNRVGAQALLDGKVTLRDLLDATEQRYHDELHQPKPPAFFLYIDQGEELYVRAEERQRRRFSEILAHGLGDPRLRALMSLRADFFGELQKDEPLYAVHRQINVPPLREAQLREVVSRPAALLSARFETEGSPPIIARRDGGGIGQGCRRAAAALLSARRHVDADGRARRRRAAPAGAGHGAWGVLVERANAFLAAHPHAEDALRRMLTLKLATVREDGEPTRRRALRSEFTDEEWRLVSELADHPNRLLVTATPEGGETYAEVAHEAIFRRWDKLREWIAAEREFLAWRNGLEAARRAWQATPDSSQERRAADGAGAGAGAKLADQARFRHPASRTGRSSR